MKALNKITFLLIVVFIISNKLFAQPGRNMVKQPPRINGVVRATATANINAKIHANSNSVFGNGNSHPNYSKKEQPQKEVRNDEGEIKKMKETGKKERQ